MRRNGPARHSVRFVGVLTFLLFSPVVAAEAGRVMYVSGEATLVRGNSIPVTKGTAVEAGDLIRTGDDGRVQLLMADGDRIALRPLTEFRIDEFSGPSRSKPGEAVAGARPSSWRSFYTLAKGGFRTLTQSLGERDPSSYQVRTPVATIGIRGTDYTVLYCTDCAAYKTASLGVRVQGMQAGVFRDSAGSKLLFAALGTSWAADFLRADALGDGSPTDQAGQLLGGVSKGEISVDGADGSEIVSDNEFFKADSSGFEFLPGMPDGLQDKKEPAGETSYQEQVGDSTEGGEEDGSDAFSARTDPTTGDGGEDAGGTGGEDGLGGISGPAGTDTVSASTTEPPPQTITTPHGDLSGGDGSSPTPPSPEPTHFRGVAYVDPLGDGGVVYGSAHHADAGKFAEDASGLTRFPSVGGNRFCGSCEAGVYDIGSAQNVDTGEDLSSGTGLRWGRWTNGTATHTTASGVESIPLGSKSLHWIVGPEAGSAQPALPVSGSFDYTLLGNTVRPTDQFGNDGALTSAGLSANFSTGQIDSHLNLSFTEQSWNAVGTGNIRANGTFGGDYTVSRGGNPGGSGNFEGFFTAGGSQSSPPPGAGMGYSLTHSGNTVTGTAAFGNPTPHAH